MMSGCNVHETKVSEHVLFFIDIIKIPQSNLEFYGISNKVHLGAESNLTGSVCE